MREMGLDGTWDGVMDARGSDAVQTAKGIWRGDRRRRGVTALALCGGLLGLAAAAPAAADEYRFELRAGAHAPASLPPLPTLGEFPVQLVLDDDGAEGAFGVLGGQTARQFLWFERFGPVPTFDLDEIWVLFPIDAPLGGAVQIVVFEDGDGDPTTGATLRLAFDATVQAADGDTFSIYPLPAPLLATSGSELLIGVVPRFIVSGQTPPLLPAALDSTASAGRSWFATWVADPPDPPSLPSDQVTLLVDGFQPGNWMIRGFGTRPSAVEIPALADWGVAALGGLLALVGFVLLRRRRAAMLLLPALVLLASSAGAQTTIDLFTTNQATLSAPPDAASTATGGADIIGTRRGLAVKNLLGTGPTSAGAAGGAFSLAVTATTPDSRGEARLSWDGDTNPTVLDPVGLGGVNLVGGSARGFRIRVNSTSVAGVELELAVHTDAANASRAARLLPLIAAPTDVLIPFSEFRVASGSGADFSDVGALELTVRGRELTVVIDEITTSSPVVAATKVDTQIVDVDTDTRVDPGDRIRYTVTITNPGNDAVSVALADTVDPNTTLIAGSTSATPIARNDQYGWFGNVTLAVDGAPFPTLLANDDDPDGDTVTVQAGTFPATTAQGGAVTLVDAASGEFSYSPPPGFAGVDTFAYTIVDDDAHTSTASAYIALAGVVWFVDDSNTTPPFNGTQADPFQTLASLMGADPDLPGDTIFVFDDDGTPYPGGLVLEAEQKLLGEGVGLVLSGTTIVPAGGTPQITNAGGAGLTLATDNTIRGLDVTATSGAGILGATFGTLTTSNLNVTATGGSALDLTTGNLAATFGTLSSTGAGLQRGLNLGTLTGSLTATTTSLTNPTTDGILVASSGTATFSFGATTVLDNAIGSGPTADGIDVATGNSGGSFTFTSLALTTDGGTGLRANASGTLNVGGTASTIASTGGPALDVVGTSFGAGATFAAVSSTNSAGKGVNLDTVSGALTINGGAISNATGVCFDVNGGAGNISYAGSISCTANNFLVEITGRTGGTVALSGNLSGTGSSNGINVASNTGGTINFSGATKTLNTGADAAVTLATNGGATINFTGGGLDIDTTSGTGFNATGGATAITVQGASNTIASTTGTALNVANTTIGGGNLNFLSVSANGAVNGIALLNTGAAGSVIVSGDGGGANNGSGGTIQNTSAEGILLNNTDNVSLGYMNVVNSGTDSIRILDLNGFTLNRSNIDDSTGATTDKAVDIGDFVTGTPVNGTVVFSNDVIGPAAGSSPHDSIAVGISGGTSTWSLTGTTIRRTGNAGINWESRGASTASVNVDGCTFAGANTPASGGSPSARGVFVNSLDDAVITMFRIQNSVFTNNNIHIDMNQQNDTDPVGGHTFEILNNTTMTGARSHAVNLFAAAGSFGGTFTGRFEGNTIGNVAVPGSGSLIGNCIRVNINGGSDATLKLAGNTLRECPAGRGIEVIGRNGTGGLDITLTGNNVDQRNVTFCAPGEVPPCAASFPLAAILVQSNCLTTCNTVRADVRANVVPATSDATDLLTSYLELVESSTSTLELVDSTAPISGSCASELAATNTGSTGVLGGCALIAGPISTP